MKAWERAFRQLPLWLKVTLKTLARPADSVYRAWYRRRSPDEHPVPPLALRSRVGARWSIGLYVRGGARTARALEDALTAQAWELAQFRSILDFGCGPGRIAVHLHDRAAPGAQVHGCDVDAAAISWASRHLPEISFRRNDFDPPLPYPPDSFDLVVASSVFTHLTEDQQERWLAELERVLAPGGFALVTTQGEAMLEEFTSGRVASNTREFSNRARALGRLARDGFLFEPYERSSLEAAGFAGIDGTYGLTFNGPEYIRKRWSERFEVRDHRPAAANWKQDLVVMRKPGGVRVASVEG